MNSLEDYSEYLANKTVNEIDNANSIQAAHQIIESKPALWNGKFLNCLCYLARNHTNVKLFHKVELFLTIAIKIVELNPQIKMDESLYGLPTLNRLVACEVSCEARTQLLYYLVFCGASYAPGEHDVKFSECGQEAVFKEIDEAKKNLAGVFSVSFELIKTNFGLDSRYFPKDIKWKIALDAMRVHCPYLLNLPGDFLVKKMHVQIPSPSIFSQATNFFGKILTQLREG